MIKKGELTMKQAIKRMLIVTIGLIIQFGLLIYVQLFLDKNLELFAFLYWFPGAIIVLIIVKNSTRLSRDIPWIIFIMLLPLFGAILYITLGKSYKYSQIYKNYQQKTKEYSKYLKQEDKLDMDVLKENDTLRYFNHYAKIPIATNTKIEYYELGEKFYPNLLEELKKAKKFIFMEYFIINKGTMWDSILEILKEKAQKGIEVRIMYDDMGSVTRLPENYHKELKKFNIKCIQFNKLSPFRGIIMNNRDHRKMTIIDGKVGFSGGVNISDEYINIKKPFGKWKDNGIKIIGNSVWNLTVMFLTLWNSNQNEDRDILKFKYDFSKEKIPQNGYVIPYGNSPFLTNYVGEDVYLNIINSSKKYLYITSPYLIIDTDMINSLTRASRRGVDVRIILPGTPDKKIVYSVTSSYFNILAKEGVKIYTYTPGFIHSKIFISDDIKSVVGTINMDYRSLYLHFENGIYMENVKEIKEVKKDIENTFKESKLLTKKDIKTNILKELWHAILRLIAPLM